MGLSGYIAAGSALVIGLMGFAVWWLYGDVQTLQANNGKLEARAQVAEATIDHLRDSFRISQEHANELEQLRQTSASNIERIGNELDMERARNYSLSLEAPVDAGDNFTRFLTWWMCEKSNVGSEQQGTCNIHASLEEAASVNFIQVFTDERADFNRRACEQGHIDACEYVLVGFTWDGWHNFQNYLMRDLIWSQDAAGNNKYFRDVLTELQKEEPEG